METKKMQMLKSVGNVFIQSKKCELKDSFFTKIDIDLKILAAYYKVTKTQAFFLAHIITHSYYKNLIDYNDLIKYFNCKPDDLLKHKDCFTELESKNHIKTVKTKHPFKDLHIEYLTINKEKVDEIFINEALAHIDGFNFKDEKFLIKEFFNLNSERDNKKIPTEIISSRVAYLLFFYSHLPFLKKLNEFELGINNAYLFLFHTWLSIIDKKMPLSTALLWTFNDKVEKYRILESFKTSKNELLTKNFVEIVEYHKDKAIKLTNKSLKMLIESGIKPFSIKQ